MTQSKFYITTPIFYPNGVPHIGHAYTALAADVFARFARLDGRDVFHLTGTDEHGLKMQQTAQKQGIETQELADKNSAVFREMMDTLNTTPDDFIRTTQPRHHKAAEALWQRMLDSGDIYLDKYAGWYSVTQEAFFEEDETTLGDDGIRREPIGSAVEWVEEESYFFKLSKYGDKLIELYETQPDFIMPKARRNEVASFVKSGLRDLSISRTTFDWGVKVPNDPAHVMYVWVDALTNYLTATGFPDDGPKSDFWPANVHIIGKDIVRFHAVYWPAFLMSAGIELPKRVFAHGFVLAEGKKMSKSVGNVVDPFEIVNKFGLDAVRFYLFREIPFGQDGSYSDEAMINRINADLANDLGNLAQRSLSMVNKHGGAAVPQPADFSDADLEILDAADALLTQAREHMDAQAIHLMLADVWRVVSDANKYFAAQEPWALRKTDMERMGTVLYVTAEVIRQVGLLIQPIMPTSAAKLLDVVGVDIQDRNFDKLGKGGRLVPGTTLPAPTGVFPRYIAPEESTK